MNKFDSREQEQFMSQRIPDKMRILLLSKHNCCEKCGSTIGLEIHHKKPLSLGGNTVEENLIVLCANCHIEAHIMDRSVFCKPFLHKIAKSFCRLLHLHFVGNCKTSAGNYSASHKPLQIIFSCYNTRYGNGSSEFSSSCACSLK